MGRAASEHKRGVAVATSRGRDAGIVSGAEPSAACVERSAAVGARNGGRRRAGHTVGAFLLAVLTACGEAPTDETNAANSGIDTTLPGPFMRPGQDCGRCHSSTSTGDVGPTWTAAGTIFADPQADAEAGVQGVLVRLTDSEGRTRETTTNEVGNFWFATELVPPLQVELVHNGTVTRMASPAPSGYCAACHTAVNPLGPPGRVFVRTEQ
jgi:hypothetical protein